MASRHSNSEPMVDIPRHNLPPRGPTRGAGRGRTSESTFSQDPTRDFEETPPRTRIDTPPRPKQDTPPKKGSPAAKRHSLEGGTPGRSAGLGAKLLMGSTPSISDLTNGDMLKRENSYLQKIQKKPGKAKKKWHRPSFHPRENFGRKGGTRTWLVFDSYGNCSLLEAQKQQVIRRTGVNARDLRILDPGSHAPASILSRDKALVCNLQHIRLILCADQVMMLVNGEDWAETDPVLASFVEDLRLRLKSNMVTLRRVESKDSNMSNLTTHEYETHSEDDSSVAGGEKGYHSDGDDRDNGDITLRLKGMKGVRARSTREEQKVHNYYEFKVLEGALESLCSDLATQAKNLEQEVIQSLTALTNKVTMFNLEGLRQVKGKMTRLISKVTQVKDELGHLLDNDDDMNEMYLTRKLVAESPRMRSESMKGLNRTGSGAAQQSIPMVGEPVVHYDVDELEDLLETFHERIFGTFNKLHALSEYIDDTEDFISISQDSHRNKLIQIDLVMTSLSFSITFLAMIASIFGMNVTSGLEDNDKAFNIIVVVSTLVSILAFVIFMTFAYVQKLL